MKNSKKIKRLEKEIESLKQVIGLKTKMPDIVSTNLRYTPIRGSWTGDPLPSLPITTCNP